MRLDAENLGCTVRVEAKIQPGADTDFQHATLGLGQNPLSIRIVVGVAHRKVDERRQDVVLVETHGRIFIGPRVPCSRLLEELVPDPMCCDDLYRRRRLALDEVAPDGKFPGQHAIPYWERAERL
jgi:hypothetical protein